MKTFSKVPGAEEQSRMIPCPLCQGQRFRFQWKVEGAGFVRCRACGLIFQNPQPVRNALAARYDKQYFEYEIANEESFFNLMILGLKDARFFESIVPTLPHPLSILDVGCATGRLLKHFLDMGWETAGSELCLESAEYGNRNYGVGINLRPLEENFFDEGWFSVVHASHLIEHVDNPGRFVSEVHRVLKPGGVFICVTPTSDGLQARLFGGAWRSVIPDHVSLFNTRTLKRLLADAGFILERRCTWGGLAVGSAPGWLKAPIDKLAKKWGFGDVILVVARKPM